MPNSITLLRLLLIVPAIVLLAGDRPGPAVAILVLFGATDRLDGWVARRFNQVSRVGKALDPIADRLGVAAILVGLTVAGVVPWPITVAVLATDLVVAVCYLVARPISGQLEVTEVGRVRTALLMLGLVLAASQLWSDSFWLVVPGLLALGGGAVLHVVAGLGYVRQFEGRR